MSLITVLYSFCSLLNFPWVRFHDLIWYVFAGPINNFVWWCNMLICSIFNINYVIFYWPCDKHNKWSGICTCGLPVNVLVLWLTASSHAVIHAFFLFCYSVFILPFIKLKCTQGRGRGRNYPAPELLGPTCKFIIW